MAGTSSSRSGILFALSFGIMVHIETDFRPRFLEWKMLRQTKKDIRRRLKGHELGFLRIIFKKHGGRIAFKFVGDRVSVEKAKRLLEIS